MNARNATRWLAHIGMTLGVLTLGACRLEADSGWDDPANDGWEGPVVQFEPGSGICTTNEQCGPSCYCDPSSLQCVVSRLCQSNGDCNGGFVCDERNTCVPPDSAQTVGDAGGGGTYYGGGGTYGAGGGSGGNSGGTGGQRQGSGGQLAGGAGGAPSTSTTGDSTCRVDKQCGSTPNTPAGTPMCQFNHQCGKGGRCEDGMCHRACTTDSNCGTGDVCRNGTCDTNTKSGGQCVFDVDCGTNTACINGTCHLRCGVDTDCSCNADMCDHGICKPDFRPVPQCKASAECNAGQACVNAVCRTPCWESSQCGPGSSGNTCLLGYCVTAQQVSPQCQFNRECNGGGICADAQCR
jgi:hypothetical protein